MGKGLPRAECTWVPEWLQRCPGTLQPQIATASPAFPNTALPNFHPALPPRPYSVPPPNIPVRLL